MGLRQKILLPLLCLIVFSQVAAALDVPPLSQRVTDLAKVLSVSEIEKLEWQLYDFEARTSIQIAVLIIPTIEDETIEGYALKVAEKWNLGAADKNNGVLLLIAMQERQLRIEVGYGLEGALTDMLASQIIRYEIVPEFKRGDYFAGIQRGLGAIMQAVQNEYQAEPGKQQEFRREQQKSLASLVFFIVFILLMLLSGRRGRRGLFWALFWSSMFRGGGGGWRSGGGLGGGGFGGFSGGGGGFGGGGASGGW